jgi:murein DD-endopeptidase MepM/ murein hydrolase activator NlpD
MSDEQRPRGTWRRQVERPPSSARRRSRTPRVKEIRTNILEPNDGARLRAPMDTGIELGASAGARRKTRTDKRRESAAGGRWSLLVLALLAMFLISAVIISRLGASPGPAAASVSVGGPPPIPAPPATRLPPLTPVFAAYRGMRIHLPIAPDQITAVAFHQASYDDGLPMDILVPVVTGAVWKAGAPARAAAVASATVAAAAPPTGTAIGPTPAALSDIWQGEVLKLYRSGRKGTPTTAVDVGGVPGTTVISPVDGVIAQVKSYKLYGKYDDYEIHIAPTGATDYEVVMLHVDGPVVKVGDKVTGGRTHIGVVRNLSKFETLQLGEYTPGAKGDHTHVQVNKLKPGVTPYTAPQTIDDTATVMPQ